MSRYRAQDVLIELLALGKDLNAQILQQLTYYKASVYKTEAAALIEIKVAQLQQLVGFIGHDELQDAFLDYAFMKKSGLRLTVPGECLVSLRVAALTQTVDKLLGNFLLLQEKQELISGDEFSNLDHEQRTQLLSMCRPFSEHWAFFSEL